MEMVMVVGKERGEEKEWSEMVVVGVPFGTETPISTDSVMKNSDFGNQ